MTIQHVKPSRRQGYTLMEMITVQAVLVALLALSWPAMRGSLEKNELVDAARQLRTELLKTRQTAMETGVARQFRYRPDTGDFQVVANNARSGRSAGSVAGRSDTQIASEGRRDALPQSADNQSTDNQSADNQSADNRSADNTAVAAQESKHSLPKDVRFGSQSLADRARFDETSSLGDSSSGGRQSPERFSTDNGNRPSAGEGDWSPPIVFFPNGRTSNARIRLESKTRHFVELALRGVTGTVTVGEVRHEAEDSTSAAAADRSDSGAAAGRAGSHTQISRRDATGGPEVR